MCRLPVFFFSALIALSTVAAPEKKERSYLDMTWWDPEMLGPLLTWWMQKFEK